MKVLKVEQFTVKHSLKQEVTAIIKIQVYSNKITAEAIKTEAGMSNRVSLISLY